MVVCGWCFLKKKRLKLNSLDLPTGVPKGDDTGREEAGPGQGLGSKIARVRQNEQDKSAIKLQMVRYFYICSRS